MSSKLNTDTSPHLDASFSQCTARSPSAPRLHKRDAACQNTQQTQVRCTNTRVHRRCVHVSVGVVVEGAGVHQSAVRHRCTRSIATVSKFGTICQLRSAGDKWRCGRIVLPRISALTPPRSLSARAPLNSGNVAPPRRHTIALHFNAVSTLARRSFCCCCCC
jgi:hypothetical protein